MTFERPRERPKPKPSVQTGSDPTVISGTTSLPDSGATHSLSQISLRTSTPPPKTTTDTTETTETTPSTETTETTPSTETTETTPSTGTTETTETTPEQPSPEEALKTKIETTYGFSLDSDHGLDALTSLFGGKQSKTDVSAKVKAKNWTLQELKYIEQALKNYGPLLGAQRSKDLGAQPLTSLSRAEMRVGKGSNNAIEQRPGTLATTFPSAKNITMFDSALTPSDFKTEEQQFQGTMEHELSHALIEDLPAKVKGKQTTMIEKYWKQMPFWKGRMQSKYWKQANGKGTTQSAKYDPDKTRKAAEKAKVEAPITNYAMDSAEEDLAETLMYFFEEPQTLKDKCPKRFQFLLDNLSDKLDPEHIKKMKKL